jgi:3-oxoacyl-[acyl-carrier-protein] synthase II
MRRVVVTGLGMVSPLGCGVEPTWKRILNSESGAKKIDTFDVSDLTSRIACVVPRGDGTGGTFNPDQWMEPKDQRKVDDFIIFAMCAARQALDDANWHPSTEEERCATGTMIGSGIGGLSGIADTALLLNERGPRKVSPFFIPGRLINLASGYVSIEHGLKGPNHAVVTACSTGAHAIGDGSRLIALGDADVMVAGGTESPICRLSMAGFCASRALSTAFNDTPEKASRPYDKARDGFVMGEGAGIVVLEEYEHAKNRGAKIYAEVIGYGLSGDAYHITSPSPDGDGAFRSMSAAMKRATPLPGCRCRRPNRQPGICWAPRERSRRSSAFLRFAITSPRRPSISRIHRWKRRSISCRKCRANAKSMSRCRIHSVSEAPMLP